MVLGYGFGARGRKVGSRDCALACSNQSPSRAPRAATRGGFAAARAACVSTWLGERAGERLSKNPLALMHKNS